MSTRKRTWLSRCRLGGLLVLLAGWLAAPSTAFGSCGEYVMIGHAAHGSMPTQEPMTPGHADSGGQHPQPQPCSGPTCSRRTPTAPLPPAPPAPERVERWGCFTAFDFAAQSGIGETVLEAMRAIPPYHGLCIYHPPR